MIRSLMASWRRRVLQILPVVGLVFVVGVHWWYSPAILFEHLDERGWILVAVGVTVFYLVRPFVLWPLSVASIFIGYLVGFPGGVPLVFAGTLVTCTPPFVLAEHYQDVNAYVKQASAIGETVVTATGELRGMVAARLSPAPADSVSIGAGLVGVSGRNFAVGTLIGELPWAVFYVMVGHSLRSFSSGSVQRVNVKFLLVVSIGAVLLLARPIYRGLVRNE